jgi:hypothetical protein
LTLNYAHTMFIATCRSSCLVLLVILGWVSTLRAQERPTVFQSWNEVQLIVPVTRYVDPQGKTSNRITSIFSGVGRIGRGELVDGRLGLELNFRANKYVTLITSVLERTDEAVDDHRHSEIRIAGGATFSFLMKEFSLRDRNLYERRARAGRNDINVYRQRLQISHPLKYKGKTIISPFLSEEAFYDMSVRRFNNNELFLGVTRRLRKGTDLDIAYIRNNTNPANVNGLSLALKIALR